MTNTRIVTTSIKSYQKRHHPKKHYVYLIDVLWSDGKSATIRRSFDEFFVFHCRLADRFKDHTLPIFPGKSTSRSGIAGRIVRKRCGATKARGMGREMGHTSLCISLHRSAAKDAMFYEARVYADAMKQSNDLGSAKIVPADVEEANGRGARST